MKNNFKQKSEVFLYQIQNSNLSCKIIVENIRILQKKYPKSIHLVVPEIAIRFEEDLSSRYPRIIKRLQVELRWWLNQWRTRRDAKSLLKKFMNNKELSEIKFTSRSLWIWIAVQKYIYSLFRPYVFEQITTQEFIDGSQIKNIAVGDLIADTYIRFSGKPSFNHNSKFTRDIWRRAAALIDYYESYIEKGSKCILFVSYGELHPRRYSA